MHYTDTGTGEVILFGHSFLWDNQMWQEQVEVLSTQYRCIVPDLWGHGESDYLDNSECNIAELADDHILLMDSLGIEKFSIIGLSVGGMWAAHIAFKYPERINKLVLCDTDLGKEPLFNKFKYYVMIKMMERANCVPPKLVEKVIPIFFSKTTLENNKKLVCYFKNKLSSISKECIPTIATLARAIFWRDSFLNELKQIKAETKIIVGSDDIARPPNEARRLEKLIPNATLSIIENSGHIPSCEQPKLLNAVLLYFFDKTAS
ncbi:MAG: alpha/beta fold hydrolase [Rickettsiales bacterium]|nr:alpha/beta fold hydrolase [Pseudomonadota bacterium]MDA0965660.1 alpha/beta fold hydrolase [Pseudomonadota bacterium]MDG4542984.1 alpha/beta fold hydrolase [Rickettsiales bacterium]MDG4544568.1 alpha/beta fold hydrolase [Rickettsiales bacterium]MDG4546690.1 alpha/beta fold hydrolase [Rickettsiales bacterium]